MSEKPLYCALILCRGKRVGHTLPSLKKCGWSRMTVQDYRVVNQPKHLVCAGRLSCLHIRSIPVCHTVLKVWLEQADAVLPTDGPFKNDIAYRRAFEKLL